MIFFWQFVFAFALVAVVCAHEKGSSYVSRTDNNGPSVKISVGHDSGSGHDGHEGLGAHATVVGYGHGGLESGHGGSSGAGHDGSSGAGHDDGHGHEDYFAHPAYKFEYGVKDTHTGDHKAQWEHRDGDKVVGEYSLDEADGTKRVVSYSSDKHNGFKADVQNIGHAEHPAGHSGGEGHGAGHAGGEGHGAGHGVGHH